MLKKPQATAELVGSTSCGGVDRFSIALGKGSAWLTLVMIIVTFVVVIMRYFFDAGLIWLQESVVWMHAFVFMIGAAYTLQSDRHVRVDIFYRRASSTGRAWIDLVGVAVFLLPLCGMLAWTSIDYAAASWALREASRIPLLKSVLVVMPAAVGLQGLAMALRAVRTLLNR